MPEELELQVNEPVEETQSDEVRDGRFKMTEELDDKEIELARELEVEGIEEVAPTPKAEPKEGEEVAPFEEKTEEQKMQEYNANEKALYHEMKAERKKRQDTEEQLKRLGYVASRAQISVQKIRQINDIVQRIDSGDEVTTKEMRDVIGDIKQYEIPNQPDPVVTQYRQAKAQTVELEGKKMYNDFDAITQMATANMSNEDAIKLNRAMNDPSVNARQIAELVADIARKNPNFTTEVESLTPAQKASRNLTRQKTSASVSSGLNSRIVNASDLTVDDLAKLSQEEYEKLADKHPKVLKRLLKQL